MRIAKLGLFVAVIVVSALAARAAELPRGDAAGAGFSPEKLQALTSDLEARAGIEVLPGAVALIARHGEIVYLEAVGERDPTTDAPMNEDAIFRIYSMTKPIVTVAAMILVEEGKLDLDEPLSTYFPEYEELKVMVEGPDGGKTVDAEGEITIADLLRHTSGLTYGFFGQGAARDAYNKAGVGSMQVPNKEFAKKLAALPLEHQPGTTWEYSRATDVLGGVIEIAAGEPLSSFVKTRILDPLGMADTGFYVPEDKADRIAQPLPTDNKIGQYELFDPRNKPAFEAGGHGMVSTARDYARFLQMLLNGGTLDGQRILSERSVAEMNTNHLGSDIQPGAYYLPGPGYGFGYGFAVRLPTGDHGWPGTPGDYYWGGAAGTYFWVDPQKDMFAILMIQAPGMRLPMRAVMRTKVYDALED